MVFFLGMTDFTDMGKDEPQIEMKKREPAHGPTGENNNAYTLD